ncbi:hypothetical protein CDO33_17455 [Clostridium thermosuccinogenes]|nr:hypothetical protein CDO33_17455 [Pseudoclostridium thermosuccinogenes]
MQYYNIAYEILIAYGNFIFRNNSFMMLLSELVTYWWATGTFCFDFFQSYDIIYYELKRVSCHTEGSTDCLAAGDGQIICLLEIARCDGKKPPPLIRLR